MARSPAPAARQAPARSPRGEARCRAVLDVARDLLIEGGPSAVCVNEVARRAGGSLATIYKHFGSREGLIEALFVSLVDDLLEAVDVVADDTDAPPEKALADIGEAFLRRALRPDALALHRALVVEGPQHPILRETLLRQGPMRVRRRLADYLAAQSRSGALRIADPRRAAVQFLGMVLAGIHVEALSGERVDTSRAALSSHVRSAVRLFLHGAAATRGRE